MGEGYIRGSQSDAKLGLSPLLLCLQMDKGNHKPRNVGSLYKLEEVGKYIPL